MWLVYYCFSNSTSNCLFLVKLVMVPWCILGVAWVLALNGGDVNLTS